LLQLHLQRQVKIAEFFSLDSLLRHYKMLGIPV
jgi:hypothetical protein